MGIRGNSEDIQQDRKASGSLPEADTEISETQNESFTDRLNRKIRTYIPDSVLYRLPFTGDYLKISDDLEKISKEFDVILSENQQERRNFWKRLKKLVRPGKSATPHNEIKNQLEKLQRSVHWMMTWGVVMGFFGGMAASTLCFSSFTSKLITFMLAGSLKTAETVPEGDVVVFITYDDLISDKGRHERLENGIQFAKEKKLPIIIAGSDKTVSTGIKYATVSGISRSRIITAETGSSVKQKVKSVKEICAIQGLEKPVIITSFYKMPRTLCEIKRAGLEKATPYPVQVSRPEIGDTIDYNPKMFKTAALEYIRFIGTGCAFSRHIQPDSSRKT